MLGLSVEVHMFMNEVHSKQKILISENLICTSHFLNSVILRKDDNASPEFGDQPEIMGGQNNRLSRPIQGKHKFYEKNLSPGV